MVRTVRIHRNADRIFTDTDASGTKPYPHTRQASRNRGYDRRAERNTWSNAASAHGTPSLLLNRLGPDPLPDSPKRIFGEEVVVDDVAVFNLDTQQLLTTTSSRDCRASTTSTRTVRLA